MHRSIGKPGLLKEINSNRVFNLLVHERKISRIQLAKSTGLSRATISLLIDELLKIGLVTEVGQGTSSGGRPPILLEFNPNTAYALGAHMHDFDWTIVLTNLDAKIIHTVEAHIPGNTPEDAVRSLIENVRSLITRVPEGTILPAIGIGSPGLVDINTGTIQSAVDIGWFDVPLGEMITRELKLDSFVVNRSKGGALAELWNNRDMNINDLIFISIGTGVAAGIIHQRALYHGANSSAGELGHMTIIPDGPACPCGNRGCLQQLISEQAIEAHARSLLKNGSSSVLRAVAGHHPEQLKAYDVLEAAEQGDSLAMEVMDTAAEYLGIAVGNLINLFNPQMIVLGGPVGNNSPLLARLLRKKVRLRAMTYPLSAVQITTSTLGASAGAIGAAVLVLQKAHQLLFQMREISAGSPLAHARPPC